MRWLVVDVVRLVGVVGVVRVVEVVRVDEVIRVVRVVEVARVFGVVRVIEVVELVRKLQGRTKAYPTSSAKLRPNFYTWGAQREDLQTENEKLKAMLKVSDAVSAELGVLKTDHQKMKTEHEKLTETLSEVRKLARIFKKKSEVAAQELAEAKSQIEAMKSEK